MSLESFRYKCVRMYLHEYFWMLHFHTLSIIGGPEIYIGVLHTSQYVLVLFNSIWGC